MLSLLRKWWFGWIEVRARPRLCVEVQGLNQAFEDVWRLTGGNPRMLSMLFEVMWNADAIIKAFVEEKRLTQSFVNRWRSVLEEAVKDPDTLWRFDADEEPPKLLLITVLEQGLYRYTDRQVSEICCQQ